MLSYIFFIVSLCLFCVFSFWWELICFLLLVLFMVISSISFVDFFCMLGFGWGADYLSVGLFILMIWISFLILVASMQIWWGSFSSGFFMFSVWVLLLFVSFVFLSCNLFLFYFFFESSLIPTFILIIGWGYQPERLPSILYLLIYTLLGSLPLLLVIFFVSNFYFSSFMFFPLSMKFSLIVYYSLMIAFLVSIPLFGFHLWLLSAHLEAPVSGSMILAGVLLSMGGYGLMRTHYLISFVYRTAQLPWFLVGLLSIGLVGCFCLMQVDIKLLIAYSSVAHMGYVVSGLMGLNQWGYTGSLILMVGHGLCSSGLFYLSNLFYERLGSRSLLLGRGSMVVMTTLSMFWFLFCSSNMASPPSLNLVGEIFLSMSIISWSWFSLGFLLLGCFLTGAYSLYLYSFSQHGKMYGGIKLMLPVTSREYMILLLHWLPLNMLILCLDLFCF